MRKFLGAVVASIVLVLGGALTASAVAEPFVAWDTGAGGVKTASSISTVTETTATLIQDGREVASLGTSAETPDLGIPVDAGDEVTVDYQLNDGANAANGAIRLFIYMAINSDTFNTAPDAFEAAPSGEVSGDSGTLALTVPVGGSIGTAGVVYDTSNNLLEGEVVFTNLRVNGESVPFVGAAVAPCEWDEDLLADDPECEEPSDPENGEENGGEEEAEETPGNGVPTAVPAGSTLPETGPSTALLAGVGVVLLAIGALLAARQWMPIRGR